MDIFEYTNKECELTLNKINHIFESMMDSFFIDCEEVRLSPVVEESMKEDLYKESVKEVGAKIAELIQKIIDTITEFCEKMATAITDKLTAGEAEKKLKQAEEAVANDSAKANKKVDMIDDKKKEEMLNKYIQEMAQLERKLVNIKLQADKSFKLSNKKDTTLIIAANEIMHEMDKLNDRYDKGMLNENQDIIQMALKDAIRFSDKQLKNVKIDYDAIKKESSRVLAVFKQDAKGCDVPVKYNLIQKMANAVGTRVRQFTVWKTQARKKNLGIIFGTALVGATIAAAHTYKTNPIVKQNVDQLAQQTGLDRVAANVKQKIVDLAAQGAQQQQPQP